MIGTISLYDQDDNLILDRRYYSAKQRKVVMAFYINKHRLGKPIKENQYLSYFQIRISAVSKLDKIIPDPPKIPIVRPPCKYDNDNFTLYKTNHNGTEEKESSQDG